MTNASGSALVVWRHAGGGMAWMHVPEWAVWNTKVRLRAAGSPAIAVIRARRYEPYRPPVEGNL